MFNPEKLVEYENDVQAFDLDSGVLPVKTGNTVPFKWSYQKS